LKLIPCRTTDNAVVMINPTHVTMLRDLREDTTLVLFANGANVPIASGIEALAEKLGAFEGETS
jgi:competence transcription factor ComK